MKVIEFIQKFKEAKIANSKVAPNAIGDYLKKELEIKTYIPFREKRVIAETVVTQNIEEIDGIKRHDSINTYVGFIVAMISTHTALEFSDDPVVDYDLLAESGLLPLIIAEFQNDYTDGDILLKMALASALEDNNINVLVGKFLNGILEKLDGVSEALKSTIGDFDINSIFKEEDLAKLNGFLNTYVK